MLASNHLIGFGASFDEIPAAWNPLDKDSSVNLSNGNRDAAVTDSSFSSVRADRANNNGKRYFEISYPAAVPGSCRAGFADRDFTLNTYVGNARISAGVGAASSNINGGGTAPQMGVSTAITVPADGLGDYFMFVIDFATGKAWVGRNGSWLSSGNPSTGANPWIVGVPGAMWPACSGYSDGSHRIHTRASEFLSPSAFAGSGAVSWASGAHSPSGFAMVGDSITHLYLTTDDWRTLSGCGTAMAYGIPSDNSTQVLARFPNILAGKPKAVFLMIGVNDGPTGLSVATSQSNIASIISLSQAAGVQIYVEKILPLAASYAGTATNAQINTLNTALQSTVSGAGAGATWVPWRDTSPLTDPTDYNADGIHLSHAGNVKRAAALASYTALYG